MRKLLPYALAGVLLGGAIAAVSAVAQNVPQGPYMGVPVFGAGLKAPSATISPAGIIYGLTGSVGMATGTGEQTLATYSLPANALDIVGRRVKMRAMFSKAANTDSVTCKLYFGSEVVSTGANTTSAAGMTLALTAVKTGASTQIVWGAGAQGTTGVTPYSAAGTETDTAAIVIKATCQDGTSAANDGVLQDMEVEYLN